MRPILVALLPLFALAGCLRADPAFVAPDRFTALGTEPFWAAKVVGGQLTYSSPGDQAGRTIAVARRSEARFAIIAGTLDGSPLRLRISAGPCSDGMSDVVYAFTIERTIGDAIERGCARRD